MNTGKTIKLISHRGNINGINPLKENTPGYIDKAISLGYDVEIDIWFTDKLYLGHDFPEYTINQSWLKDRSKNLWVHCKNFKALSKLIDSSIKVFYHQKENHTIIGNTNIIWSHQIHEADHKSIIPLLDQNSINQYFKSPSKKLYGICSDYVQQVKEKL